MREMNPSSRSVESTQVGCSDSSRGSHTVREVAQLLNLHEHAVRTAVRGLKAKGYFS